MSNLIRSDADASVSACVAYDNFHVWSKVRKQWRE